MAGFDVLLSHGAGQQVCAGEVAEGVARSEFPRARQLRTARQRLLVFRPYVSAPAT